MNRLYLFLFAGLLVCRCEAESRAARFESALVTLAKKTTALLPNGWSASQTNRAIMVRRIAPVRMVNLINAPDRIKGESEDAYLLAHSYMDHYSISLRLGEPLSLQQLAEMRWQNAGVQEKLTVLEKQMRHITHKFDDYLPSTPQEKKLVAEYAATKAAYREVPEHHYQGFAAYVTVEPSDMYVFYSQKDSQECERVRAAVLSNLQPYESKAPNLGGRADGYRKKRSTAAHRQARWAQEKAVSVDVV